MFNANPGRHAIEGPSPAELKVIPHLIDGASDHEIAKKIHRSESTVKTHIGSLCLKLHARNRTHLAVIAVRQGLGV